jgi:hypothetical protein
MAPMPSELQGFVQTQNFSSRRLAQGRLISHFKRLTLKQPLTLICGHWVRSLYLSSLCAFRDIYGNSSSHLIIDAP